MLILTRRIGESVYIGDEVRLTVLGVRGTQVRIGINAPKDIPVHREEIYYKIKHEQGGDGPVGHVRAHDRGNEYPRARMDGGGGGYSGHAGAGGQAAGGYGAAGAGVAAHAAAQNAGNVAPAGGHADGDVGDDADDDADGGNVAPVVSDDDERSPEEADPHNV